MYATIIKTVLKELPLIIKTAGIATKEIKALLPNKSKEEKLKTSNPLEKIEKAIELQTKVNDELENQMKIIQTVLENIQKSLRLLTIISFGAMGLAVIAIILSIR